MGYLDNSVGRLAGMLPAPHADVHIAVGPLGEDRLFVAYTGVAAGLLAAGAIDAAVMASRHCDRPRDGAGRPCHIETIAPDSIRVVRAFTSIQRAADLPGIDGGVLHVEVLRRRSRDWRLLVSDPDSQA
jgi:hypothetical protein